MNIDEYDPCYPNFAAVSQKRSRKRRRIDERVCYVRIYRGGRSGMLGIRQSTMRDWRSLERRTAELLRELQFASDTFDRVCLAKISESLCDTIVAELDDNLALQFGANCIRSLFSQDYLLKKLLQNPNHIGDFSFISKESGGREIGRLYKRMNRLNTAYNIYKQTFITAIEDRLRKFVEKTRKLNYGSHASICEPAVVVLENETRHHVFMIESDCRIKYLVGGNEVIFAGGSVK